MKRKMHPLTNAYLLVGCHQHIQILWCLWWRWRRKNRCKFEENRIWVSTCQNRWGSQVNYYYDTDRLIRCVSYKKDDAHFCSLKILESMHHILWKIGVTYWIICVTVHCSNVKFSFEIDARFTHKQFYCFQYSPQSQEGI